MAQKLKLHFNLPSAPLTHTTPDHSDVYCPECHHHHFGHGPGICGGVTGPSCTCKHLFSKEPEFFLPLSTTLKKPITYTADNCPYKEPSMHPEACKWCSKPYPSNAKCHCIFHCGWINCGGSKKTTNPPADGVISSMPTPIIVKGSISKPRTQKAKGLRGMANFKNMLQRQLGYEFPDKPFYLCKVERVLGEDNVVALATQLLKAWRLITCMGKFKMFARPAPHRPRHGFVDSRVLELGIPEGGWAVIQSALLIANSTEVKAKPEEYELLKAFIQPLKDLATEVRSHDKRGEIILMPFVEASMGAIYANGAVTVGLGNEGATSGTDSSIFPCANIWPEAMDKAFWSKLGIENSPFLEVVYEPVKIDEVADEGNRIISSTDPIKANPFLVQLRDGPWMEGGTGDYIPSTVELDPYKVINVHSYCNKNNLIAFEKDIENAPLGTIVIHKGGAISSHYGIHCVMHKVPYVVSKELCEWIKMWSTVRKHCHSYFVDGDYDKTDILTTEATFTLQATGHTNSHNGAPDKLSWHKGFNAGLAMEALPYADSMIQSSLYFLHSSSAINFNDSSISYAFGFCLAQSLKLGMLALVGEARHRIVDIEHRLAKTRDREMIFREAVYRALDSIPPELLVKHSMEIGKAFKFSGWGSGIGGYNWHLCAIEVSRTWNACVDYLEGGDFTPVLAGFNNVIHASHNGAKMLTKFSTIATMDLAVKCPPVMALITAPILWYLTHNQNHEVRKIDIKRAASAKEVEEAVITPLTRAAFATVTMEPIN